MHQIVIDVKPSLSLSGPCPSSAPACSINVNVNVNCPRSVEKFLQGRGQVYGMTWQGGVMTSMLLFPPCPLSIGNTDFHGELVLKTFVQETFVKVTIVNPQLDLSKHKRKDRILQMTTHTHRSLKILCPNLLIKDPFKRFDLLQNKTNCMTTDLRTWIWKSISQIVYRKYTLYRKTH